jgi:threonine/homoserine/homoserine lactone efflux protein
MLNPKTAAFFLAFVPQFVDPAAGAVAAQVLMLGLVFATLAIISDGAYALAAGSLGAWFRAREGPRRWLGQASGGVYIALGASAALTTRPAK